MPGAARGVTTYVDIAENLGKYKIVPKNFAENTLKKMAKYRNRLVHGYSKITAKKTHEILKKHLKDIEKFLSYIKKLLENPEKFGLTIE